MSTAEQIRATIEPALASLGLVIEDVTISPAGKRRVVRVLVDTDIASLDPADTSSPVPPISLDDVADATRVVSDRLDDSRRHGPGALRPRGQLAGHRPGPDVP